MRPEQNNGCPRNRLANAGQKSIAFAKRFGREEDGVMVAFALMMLIAMLMVGGIGIDLMRFEMDRTRLQNTLDRAVLAAADLDQTLDAKEVVQDYFSKAGLSEYLSGVRVQEGLGSKRVEADAETTFDTFFLKLMGVETLTATANGAAMETIDGLEISLVLDVSGSMNSNQRLIRLKPAAKEFVETILSSNDSGNVSISIIPYATQVSAGAQILDQLDVSDEHSYSHCVNFVADEFSHAELHTTGELERTAHFDPFTYSEYPIDIPVCPVGAASSIFPLSKDIDALKSFIDGLTAKGNTSIDIGVKWGTLMLDPSMQDVVDGLIDDGAVSSDFAGRPVAYGSGGLMKIIVLMSDGQNTDQYMLNPSLREGNSPVYVNTENGRYSVYHSSGGSHSSSAEEVYYWPHTDSWYDHPYGDGSFEACEHGWVQRWNSKKRDYYWSWEEINCAEIEEPGDAVRLTYPELFNLVSLKWNAHYNYADMSNAWATWYEAAFTKVESSAKDQRSKHICNAAKDEGIIVYTIGFEAPKAGQRVLRYCASSDGHYFDVDGLEIEDAFSSIAASIRKLKLIQ